MKQGGGKLNWLSHGEHACSTLRGPRDFSSIAARAHRYAVPRSITRQFHGSQHMRAMQGYDLYTILCDNARVKARVVCTSVFDVCGMKSLWCAPIFLVYGCCFLGELATCSETTVTVATKLAIYLAT